MEEEYYKTPESVEEYINLAKDVSGILLIEKLREILPEKSSVLELGSGPGTDWRILSQTYSVVGSDNSIEFLNYLKANNPDGEFIALDAGTLRTEKTFDAIYSNKVLHHLAEDELTTSVPNQAKILNSNGIICHSFWKGDGEETFKGLFVKYHDEQSIRNYFEKYFDIISITSYAEFEEGDSLLLIARRK